jgi:hypothetical protein
VPIDSADEEQRCPRSIAWDIVPVSTVDKGVFGVLIDCGMVAGRDDHFRAGLKPGTRQVARVREVIRHKPHVVLDIIPFKLNELACLGTPDCACIVSDTAHQWVCPRHFVDTSWSSALGKTAGSLRPAETSRLLGIIVWQGGAASGAEWINYLDATFHNLWDYIGVVCWHRVHAIVIEIT